MTEEMEAFDDFLENFQKSIKESFKLKFENIEHCIERVVRANQALRGTKRLHPHIRFPRFKLGMDNFIGFDPEGKRNLIYYPAIFEVVDNSRDINSKDIKIYPVIGLSANRWKRGGKKEKYYKDFPLKWETFRNEESVFIQGSELVKKLMDTYAEYIKKERVGLWRY